MIIDFLRTIIGVALKLLMYPIIFGGGLALLIYSLLAIKKDIEIKNIVFAQAYEEKYMFKRPKLKESYEDEICELMSLKIYYPKSDYLGKSRIFEYFENEGNIKIVPLDIETELL